MADYERLRQRLQEEQEHLNQQLEQLKSSAPAMGDIGEGSPFGKREEEATETSELERRLALERHMRNLLDEVEYALSKFAKGNYGLCESCGQPIDLARLEILPQAKLCLICKSRQTKGAKAKFTL